MNSITCNGIKFIAIKNLENRCCYHVAVLQLFHTSPTFNNLMINATIPNQFKIMLRPFKEYALINDSTYQRVNEAYKELDDMMSNNVKKGYSSHLFIYYYLLPLLNKVFPQQFEAIANEVRADPIHFNVPKVKSHEIYTVAPFLKHDNEIYEQLHEDMIFRYMSGNLKLQHQPLVGAIIEIFPSAYTVDDGHALFLLKSEGVYYVFDDNTTIDLLDRYVKNRSTNIAKLCIYTNDDTAVKEIQQLWGSDAMTARVNNRWEITEHVKDVVVPIYRFLHAKNMDELTLSDEEVTIEEQLEKCQRTKIILIIALAVVLIIVIIEVVLILKKRSDEKKKNRQQYQCPCQRNSSGI